MPSSFFALFDDIATLLDDVSVMTKVATQKTAGVLGDDLALNAQQVSGVNALLDPEISAKRQTNQPNPVEDLEKLMGRLGRSKFGRAAAARMEESLIPLMLNTPLAPMPQRTLVQ